MKKSGPFLDAFLNKYFVFKTMATIDIVGLRQHKRLDWNAAPTVLALLSA